jgi:hypothetical protein
VIIFKWWDWWSGFQVSTEISYHYLYDQACKDKCLSHELVILWHNCEWIYLHNSQQLNSIYPCWQSPWYGDDESGVHTKLFFTLRTHLQQCVNGSTTVGCGLLFMPVHLSEDELGDHRKWPSSFTKCCYLPNLSR